MNIKCLGESSQRCLQDKLTLMQIVLYTFILNGEPFIVSLIHRLRNGYQANTYWRAYNTQVYMACSKVYCKYMNDHHTVYWLLLISLYSTHFTSLGFTKAFFLINVSKYFFCHYMVWEFEHCKKNMLEIVLYIIIEKDVEGIPS